MNVRLRTRSRRARTTTMVPGGGALAAFGVAGGCAPDFAGGVPAAFGAAAAGGCAPTFIGGVPVGFSVGIIRPPSELTFGRRIGRQDGRGRRSAADGRPVPASAIPPSQPRPSCGGTGFSPTRGQGLVGIQDDPVPAPSFTAAHALCASIARPRRGRCPPGSPHLSAPPCGAASGRRPGPRPSAAGPSPARNP
jgi:hypothetical protein